jgi:hypothetical protein
MKLLLPIAICFAGLSAADVANPQTAFLDPVWTLDACKGPAAVVHNDFGTERLGEYPFPLDVVRIVETKRYEGSPMELPFATLLRVSPNGELMGSSSPAYGMNIRVGPFGDEPIVVLDGAARSALGDAVSQFDPLEGIDRSMLGFPVYEPSRHDGIGALFLKNRTVITRGPLLDDCLQIPIRGCEAAFARDANVGAVILLHFYPDQEDVDHRPLPSSLWAFDFSGNVFYKSPEQPGRRGYSQLYVSNDGRWAMVTKQGPEVSTIATDEVVFIDLQTGDTVAIEGMNGGSRYHSLDGRYMVLSQPGWERAYLFDLALPMRPTLLWRRDDIGLGSIAINQDGSLLAALGNESATLLDRSGQTVARIPRHVTNGFGMMFAGDFLVIGMQSHPLPAYVDAVEALRVDVYHVGEFK